jgi:hypothetical protein
MPLFGATVFLPRCKNQKRNLLNRGCLLNGKLNFSLFFTAISTGALRGGPDLQVCMQESHQHLDARRHVRHGW